MCHRHSCRGRDAAALGAKATGPVLFQNNDGPDTKKVTWQELLTVADTGALGSRVVRRKRSKHLSRRAADEARQPGAEGVPGAADTCWGVLSLSSLSSPQVGRNMQLYN